MKLDDDFESAKVLKSKLILGINPKPIISCFQQLPNHRALPTVGSTGAMDAVWSWGPRGSSKNGSF
jgi:hypothetical protein